MLYIASAFDNKKYHHIYSHYLLVSVNTNETTPNRELQWDSQIISKN